MWIYSPIYFEDEHAIDDGESDLLEPWKEEASSRGWLEVLDDNLGMESKQWRCFDDDDDDDGNYNNNKNNNDKMMIVTIAK